MVDVACPSCTDMDPDCTECFGTGMVQGQDRSRQNPRRSGEFYGYTQEGEEWEPYPEAPRYHISNKGRVINTDTGRMMAINENNSGLLMFKATKNGAQHAVLLHRNVARLFLPDYQERTTVEFIDGDKKNCAADNLRIGTRVIRGKGKPKG